MIRPQTIISNSYSSPLPAKASWTIVLLALLIGQIPAIAQPPLVPSPLGEALANARAQGKPLLVAFLGTDWSVASRRMAESILETQTFQDWAQDHLIYYPVQARRKPKLSSAETASLQAMVVHFDVKSYPTVILLDPDGKERLRHGYREMAVADYIELLTALLP